MKKSYEKPVMKAEEFVTNAYCGSCEGQFVLNGRLDVSPDSWGSSNMSSDWSDRDNLVPNAEENITHSFVQKDSIPMRDDDGDAQYFWKCSHAVGCPYYLEFSHDFTERNNGAETFFLYKEVNGRDGLQISGGFNWPLQNRGDDLCVAQVVYTTGKDPVVNS